MGYPGDVRLLLLVVATLLSACGTPQVTWEKSFEAPYGTFDTEQLEAFRAARREIDAGALERARTRLATLLGGAPNNLEIAVWLQDVELALLRRGSPPAEDLRAALEGAKDPDEALRTLYAKRLEAAPSPAGYVLAARAETDAIAARSLLERAIELDPTCAWAHYGRAYALLQDRHEPDRWELARSALSRALALDPSHLHARALEAWMLAQEGSVSAAARALELWLRRSADDPRVHQSRRISAQLDLAQLWILEGHPREAAALLRGLEGVPQERPRRLAILAVALHEQGDAHAALDAARRAELAAESPILPLVQEALLFASDLGDPEAAQERWREVAGAEAGDLGAILQTLRARVELERAGVDP